MSGLTVYLRHLLLFSVFSVALESEKPISYISSLWSCDWFLKTEAGKHKGKYLTICLQCASKLLLVKFVFACPAPNTEPHVRQISSRCCELVNKRRYGLSCLMIWETTRNLSIQFLCLWEGRIMPVNYLLMRDMLGQIEQLRSLTKCANITFFQVYKKEKLP